MPSSSSSSSSRPAATSAPPPCPLCPVLVPVPGEPPVLLPPGFRFRPTDPEMVALLRRKLSGLPPDFAEPGDPLFDADVSLRELKQLSRNTKDHMAFFFTTRTVLGSNGEQPIRRTPKGCWKGTGKERVVRDGSGGPVVGFKKMFVYYSGKAPNEVKTHWMMQEVRMNPQLEQHNKCDPQKMESWVLCKVYDKLEEEKLMRGFR